MISYVVGLFRNAIMESGYSPTLFALARHSLTAARSVGAQLGIKATNSRSLVKELRKVDYRTLQKAALTAVLSVSNKLGDISL